MAALTTNTAAAMAALTTNTAEDILFIVDVGADELNETAAGSAAAAESPAESRLDVVKAGLQHFVRHKSRLSSKHRFGVCMLAGDALWVLDFTPEIDIVLATVNSLQVVPGSNPSEPFEFDELTALLTQVKGSCHAAV